MVRDVAEILSLFRDGLTASAWSPTICASIRVLENADAMTALDRPTHGIIALVFGIIAAIGVGDWPWFSGRRTVARNFKMVCLPSRSGFCRAFFVGTVTVGWNLGGQHLLNFEISWEDMMGSAMTCPETGERMPFNIKADAKSVAQAWNQFIRVNCPHCGGRHDVLYKEVYMDGVLTGFPDDFALVLLDKRQRSRLNTKRKTPDSC